MPIIMLIMYRNAIVQGLMNKLQGNPDIHMIYEPDYDHAHIAARNSDANVVLIEATESGHYDMAYCLALSNWLRKHIPKCKILLMCSEQDEKSVKEVVAAKWARQIDDFVFYDVTIDYLASKIISICK